ncbi:Hypothetical protein PSEBR_a1311 [Pseudomonas brassicacearum subsp. brassicacearum NFM421]|uniref:PIN like domain-containing protein n=1 Tax=Pseudomonas brassicacearum (strain NFM421) TaxID=994484 RepID=F2KE21_PSEBN|nr:PIN domain-containing protein [Pseudomonas brassicacearum]AEA67498.1 Hypothetical protein PSEBR_a1311 [Pseudomonas brassicacearum subsp. brassicacearum NFM421]
MSLKFNKSAKYPIPSDTFGFKLETISNVKDTCLFVLDANVLLLPYGADASSLKAIRSVYEILSEQNRVFIPAQAAREFFDNRSKKLADIHELLSKKMSQNFQFITSHPFLNEISEFKAVIEKETKLKELIKGYRKEINNTLGIIQSWGWDDPVSKMYHEVLSKSVLSDSEICEKEMEEDLIRRSSLKIPPGYKDGGKNENQAGDLLIWHELLRLGSTKSQHVIFVSGDEKADWWHQSGGKNLYPRFELVDEFRTKTDGKSFHIISLSDLLRIFNADANIVEAIETSERNSLISTSTFTFPQDQITPTALNIVNSLRALLAEYDIESDKIQAERASAMRKTPEEDRSLLWNAFNEIDNRATRKLMMEYEHYKIDAILFRDGLLELLPNTITNKRPEYFGDMYERPTNPLGIRAVIDDLEYLAKCYGNSI